MHKLISLLSAAFLGFITWIIYLANTGQNSIFFNVVASIPYGDKLGHFCLFGLLALGGNFIFRLKSFDLALFYLPSVNIYLGSSIVLLFALIEELSQYFIANRTLDAIDLLADVAGVMVFSLVTKFISKRL